VTLLAFLQFSCATLSQINLLSTADEIEIGRQAADDVEKSLPMLQDSVVVAYIQELGRVLAKQAKRQDVTYSFKVVDTEEVNAFALPGGWLYVNAGLIATADTESELAGVSWHTRSETWSVDTARARYRHSSGWESCWRLSVAGRTVIR
jgi:predicted Zn-dependent protease